MWRNAKALVTLRAEVDKLWTNRDHASDGTIGDKKHQQDPTSDHNPFVKDAAGHGVVRALDVDSGPGLDPNRAHDTIGDVVAEAVRLAGLNGHPALQGGGYVISEGRIASARKSWAWRTYTGDDPHESHVHISVGLAATAFDNTKSWPLNAASPVDPNNPDSGPFGLFPISATHAFGPRGPGGPVSFHDGSCHLLCARAIGAIRREVGAASGNRWAPDLTPLVRAWQEKVHDSGTPGQPIDGVVRKVTWDTMTRR